MAAATRTAAAPGRWRSFTLLEVLVATAILVTLGTSLIVILRGGLETWRRAEARRETFERAQAVLLQLREDLASAVPPATAVPRRGLGEVEARLLCDEDAGGRPRLFLVRSIKGESEHPLTGLAGGAVGADAVIDQRDDLAQARQARLRATGGALEVAWVLGEGGLLYRGIRAPIGPPRSFFGDVTPYELAPPPAPIVPGAVTTAAAPEDEAEDAEDAAREHAPSDRPALLRPFAAGVLHLEYRFWTQYTTTWSERTPALRAPREGEESGPLPYWDSTRALVRAEVRSPREFHTFVGAGSLSDPRDDILPSKVKVILVLEEPPSAGSTTYLLAPADAQARELVVQDPGRLDPDGGFLYVGGEWVRYDGLRGDRVQVAPEGRGARGTAPRAHDGNHPVQVGRTFEVILALPAGREDWGDRDRGGE